jgi:hypothetical protein
MFLELEGGHTEVTLLHLHAHDLYARDDYWKVDKDTTGLDKRRARGSHRGAAVHEVLDLIVRQTVLDEHSYLNSTEIARNEGCGLLTVCA